MLRTMQKTGMVTLILWDLQSLYQNKQN